MMNYTNPIQQLLFLKQKQKLFWNRVDCPKNWSNIRERGYWFLEKVTEEKMTYRNIWNISIVSFIDLFFAIALKHSPWCDNYGESIYFTWNKLKYLTVSRGLFGTLKCWNNINETMQHFSMGLNSHK